MTYGCVGYRREEGVRGFQTSVQVATKPCTQCLQVNSKKKKQHAAKQLKAK